MQIWVLGEAECLQQDAMSTPTFPMLLEYGYSLTHESYLSINNVDEDDLDAEQEIDLPDLFQKSKGGLHIKLPVTSDDARSLGYEFAMGLWPTHGDESAFT
jgi:hypothetical protein